MEIHMIGNGPSLMETDLHKLKNKHTISYNRAYISYSTWGWYPTYYMILDVFLFPKNSVYVNDINNLIFNSPIKYFFICDRKFSDGRSTKDFINNHDKVTFFKTQNVVYRFPTKKKEYYSYWGNVIIASFQFMYELGYRDFYLHGVDARNLSKHYCKDYIPKNIPIRSTYRHAHIERWLEFIESWKTSKRGVRKLIFIYVVKTQHYLIIYHIVQNIK